jgi:hypothetical protein
MGEWTNKPEKSRTWLEMESLKRCQRRPGCSHLEAIRIGRIKLSGSGPNWKVLHFEPELNSAARGEAMEEIARLQGTYALANGRAA